MMQRKPEQQPFERVDNIIVGLIVIVLMIIGHYISWQFGHKYETDTGLTAYFYYVIDLVYNWVLT